MPATRHDPEGLDETDQVLAWLQVAHGEQVRPLARQAEGGDPLASRLLADRLRAGARTDGNGGNAVVGDAVCLDDLAARRLRVGDHVRRIPDRAGNVGVEDAQVALREPFRVRRIADVVDGEHEW